ncbi:MAG: hypothetical protein ACRCTD_07015 [Beijerinckiaceae bacterium]
MRLSLPAGWPKSLIWFIITGVLFLFQLFPYTGVFLMLVLAPFWSIVLLNIGFVALGVEAVIGRIAIVWLLAPIIWFGGYTVAFWQSQRAFDQLGDEIAAFNAGKALPFDSRAQDLVLTTSDYNIPAGALVQNYDVQAVYKSARGLKTAQHISYQLGVDPLCKTIRSDARYGAASVYATGVRDDAGTGTKRTRTMTPGLCMIHAPQDPRKPVVHIEAKDEKRKGFLLPAILTRITLSDGQGRRVELMHGRAAILSAWPKLAMGCALNSGGPSWDCDAGFMRQSQQDAGGAASASDVIAKALGLRAATPSSRRDALTAIPGVGLQDTVSRREDTSLTNLDRAIADTSMRITVHDFAGLTQNTALLVSRADGLVSGLRNRLAAQHPIAEGIKNFGNLIAALPDAEFKRRAPEVLTILQGAREINLDNMAINLAYRLADLGPAALPLLERYAFEKPVRWAGSPYFALCRLGAPAAHHAERIAQTLYANGPSYTTQRKSESHMAAYITLLRFGRRDLLAGEHDADSQYRRKDYAYWSQTITPASPADDCTAKNAPRGRQ